MSKFSIKKEKLLVKIGKKIGIDLAYLIKNGSWVTLRFSVLALGGWLVSMFFARMGSKELLGEYQFILSSMSIISLCSLPGLNAAALESVVKGYEAGVIKAVKLSFVFSLLGFPILAGWGIFNILFKGDLLLGETLIFSGLLFPFYYALNTWSVYYDGKSLFKETSIRVIIINICLYTLLILGLIFKLNIFGLIAIYLLVNILFFGYYFIEVVKKIKDVTKNFIDIKFGINASIQKFVFGLSSNIPPLAISFLFGIESVAIYYIAFYAISAIFAFLGTLFYLYIPALFRGSKLNHKNIILQNIFIGIFFWAIFVIFLKLFFILIYGLEYQKSLELAYIISFLLLFIPLKTYLINFFMTQKLNWTLIVIVGFANTISFLLLYFMKDQNFIKSVAVYLYALELMTTLPLFFVYIQKVFVKSNKIII